MPVFEYTGELQFYTIPSNVCTVRIRAEGAQGGNFIGFETIPGGLGASIQGDFSVKPGETLTILVGGAGVKNTTGSAGGGGGSFVWRGNGFDALNESTLLIAAGAGGGGTNTLNVASINPPVCNFPTFGVTTITGLLNLSVDGLIGLSLPFTLTIDTNTNVVTLTINILGIPLTLTPLSAAGLTIIDCND